MDGKVGEWRYFDEYGNLTQVANYKNDKAEGKVVDYYPWGAVEGEYYYKDDKLEGIHKTYYGHAQLKRIGYFEDGESNGVWKSFYPDGTIKTESYYLNGEIKGAYKYYTVNGKLDRVDYYKDGFLQGVVCYDTSESIMSESQFEDGIGVGASIKSDKSEIVSRLLTKVRSLQSEVNAFSTSQGKMTRNKINSSLEDFEAKVDKALEYVELIRDSESEITSLNEQLKALLRIAPLGIPLDLMSGYEART